VLSIETFYPEVGGIVFTPQHCYPCIRTLDIIILDIDFVLKFIASVTTGMKNFVGVLDQTFAKMSNMLTVE